MNGHHSRGVFPIIINKKKRFLYRYPLACLYSVSIAAIPMLVNLHNMCLLLLSTVPGLNTIALDYNYPVGYGGTKILLTQNLN